MLDPEPPPADARLLTLTNMILAPHSLSWTDQCFVGIGADRIGSVRAIARGEIPGFVVNNDVLDRGGFRAKVDRYRMLRS